MIASRKSPSEMLKLTLFSILGASILIQSARQELIRGVRGMTGRTLRIESGVPTEPTLSTLDGDEVVQLYLDGGGGADDPIRELRGFERIRDVEFTISDLPKRKARISIGNITGHI